jgi:hypothetical protein
MSMCSRGPGRSNVLGSRVAVVGQPGVWIVASEARLVAVPEVAVAGRPSRSVQFKRHGSARSARGRSVATALRGCPGAARRR